MTFFALRSLPFGRSLCGLALGVLLVAGCRPFQAATPPGFVELADQQHYDYRATTADGVVLGIRALEHEPRGELSFWVSAIERQLRERNGYALLEVRDVQTVHGLAGKQLRFGHDEGRQPHLYYVTLFVTDDRLYLIEAGGQKDRFEERAQQIEWAVTNFRAK